MAWCRIHLTEDERRIVNEERASYPNLLVRNKMLTIWLLHCGVTRQKAAKLVGARQLVRQDGDRAANLTVRQPLQLTQTCAPTGERLRILQLDVSRGPLGGAFARSWHPVVGPAPTF